MTFRSSPKAWTSANCEVSWRSRISKLQMQKPEVPLFSSGGNGLGHRETLGNRGKFQVPKPQQVPFIHMPCVPMLFWHRCLGLRVILGHVGSMAVPNHQPSNSFIKKDKREVPSSNSTYSDFGHDFIITSYVILFYYFLFSTSKQINSLRTATKVC